MVRLKLDWKTGLSGRWASNYHPTTWVQVPLNTNLVPIYTDGLLL